ncbi:hypothetical protein AURDEDRAFT_164297 [Auricularia subglabra TFB-10046 SS5]|nr:hypothetical protein AURDEDRAFT_164297 [Auricularia subglabra TFB-10046 SS5]
MLWRYIALVPTPLAAWARLVNVTIDDQHGDLRTGSLIHYNNYNRWFAISDGNATRMNPEPDWTQIQNGTLHTCDLADPWYFRFSFQGSAVYVFFTLFSGAATTLEIAVTAHPPIRANYSHVPSTTFESGHYMYRVPVFSHENLLPGTMYNVWVSNLGPPNGTSGTPAYALFDYAIYTIETDDDVENSTPPASPKQPRHVSGPLIAASVIGGILVVASAVWCVRRRSTQRQATATTAWKDDSGQPEPFPRPGKAIIEALSASDEKGHPTPAEKLPFEKAPPRPAGTAEAPSHATDTDSAAELRARLERVLEENEILRQAGPPPEYPHGERREGAINA